MAVEIVSIVDRPDLIEASAQWQWEQWGRRAGATMAQMVAFVAGHTATSGINQCFVLLDGGTPAGTVTTEAEDLAARPDLSPWLANLVVDEAFRGRGHANRLVRHVEAAFQAAGITPIYLNTEHAAGLYTRLGWIDIGTAPHNGHSVTIMRRDLT